MSEPSNIIILVSSVTILLVSLYLATCQKYQDGVIGHLALAGMSIASAVPIYEAGSGMLYEFVPTTALLYAAVALFLARHAYRFRQQAKRGCV